MLPIIRLPARLQHGLDAAASNLLHVQGAPRIDFTQPRCEQALVPPDSVSWRIFKNPVALFIGGVGGVLLELAEPSVRTGVWEHSSFQADPLRRLRRTGMAAMVTVYGARSIAEPMIAGISRMHAKVIGKTPQGIPYCADDARLLTWVHATAAFGFGEAYSRYVEPLGAPQRDAFYREGTHAARLYGALDAPRSSREVEALFESMRGRLEPSPAIFQFLKIMRDTAAFPGPLRWMQSTLVRAAVELIPGWIRGRLGLTAQHGLRKGEGPIVRWAGSVSNRIVLSASPAIQSCLRLGLPATHLYEI